MDNLFEQLPNFQKNFQILQMNSPKIIPPDKTTLELTLEVVQRKVSPQINPQL